LPSLIAVTLSGVAELQLVEEEEAGRGRNKKRKAGKERGQEIKINGRLTIGTQVTEDLNKLTEPTVGSFIAD
jgi:hypothetical protein